MTIIGIRSRVSLFLIAAVLLQLSAGVAAGQADARSRGPVEVAFTKWRTAVLPPPTATATRSLFAGNVGGELGEGDFVGEVLYRQASTPCSAFVPPCTPDVTPPTISEYEVQAGEHSFIALIQGGSNSAGGRLEGVIVSGWRIGAQVSVAFDTLPSCTGRDGVAHGPCFDGTIRVGRPPEK
jgi:hypothetical protein